MKVSLSQAWTFLIGRFRITMLIILMLLISGLIGYNTMPRELTPQIDVPVANVITAWPGASPDNVESLITEVIEREIDDLPNLEEYTSTSSSGLSVVTIEFDPDADKDLMIQKIRERVDQAKPKLPDSIPEEPRINEVSFSDIPILGITISGDYSWSELKRFSKTLEDEIQTIPNVKEINVSGAPEDQYQVLVDRSLLSQYKIGLNEVVSALRSQHLDVPLGVISMDDQNIEVSLDAKLESLEDFFSVPITYRNGSLINLLDVAEVRRGFDTFDTETLRGNPQGSNNAVSLSVIKSASEGNVITMVEKIFERIETFQARGLLPQELIIEETFNRSDDIQNSLDTLVGSGGQTLLLIFIVMLLFLGIREAVLASVAIPLSLLGGVFYLQSIGETFNGTSLFALVLTVGLLVDNAIIIVEGIAENIHGRKMKPKDAAMAAVKTFRWPIITGTLTTIFAFLPMLWFVTGISGQYIRIIPVSVMAVLVIALFVGLWVLASVAIPFYTRFRPKPKPEGKRLIAVKDWYERFMRKVLNSRKKVRRIIALCVLFFFSSFLLIPLGLVPVEVFPRSDESFFEIKIELPQGTDLDHTREFREPVIEALNKYFSPQQGETWMKNYVLSVGRTSNGSASSNIIDLDIGLVDKEERKAESNEIAQTIFESIRDIMPSYIDVTLVEQEGGPPVGAAVEVEFIGDDLGRLESMLIDVQAQITELEGVKNVRDTRAEKTFQMRWAFDRQKLITFGLTPAQVQESLRAAVSGVTVLNIVEGDEEIDVDVRVDWDGEKVWDDPSSLEYVGQIPLITPSGDQISFDQVATSIFRSELSRVERRDGQRILLIQADTIPGVAGSEMTPEIQQMISQLELLPGEQVKIGGGSEEGNKILSQMIQAFLFAFLLIMIVLVWQFNSFFQAGIVLSMIPLSLVPVFFGFAIAQLKLGIPTMIGVVALAGIIVNDAIVLLDTVRAKRDEHEDTIDASIHAGRDRLQPIFLTSLTTVVGMLPLSLSDPLWMGLGFSIIFGMMFSTVLTLILIPVFLRIRDFRRVKKSKTSA